MKTKIIKAPEFICIYNLAYIYTTYDLLYKINSEVFDNDVIVHLDLSDVKLITAAASVLLFATVNTCQLANKNPNQIRCIFPKDKVNEAGHNCIVKTGLARALHSGSILKLKDLVTSEVYFQSEINAGRHISHTVDFLTSKVDLSAEQFEMLSSAITEAMLNVSHHAYKDPTFIGPIAECPIHPKKEFLVDRQGERWWQCAWYNEQDKIWVFIICDLGLGIPETYLANKPNNKEPFSTILKEAFTIGNSRYIGQGRGNGSENIKSPVGLSCKKTESLLVYSGGIRYEYNSEMEEPKVNDLNKFFSGTLVEWTLSVGG